MIGNGNNQRFYALAIQIYSDWLMTDPLKKEAQFQHPSDVGHSGITAILFTKLRHETVA